LNFNGFHFTFLSKENNHLHQKYMALKYLTAGPIIEMWWTN
jgi:hypothetical protein